MGTASHLWVTMESIRSDRVRLPCFCPFRTEAWTTDWMSQDARERLRQYGISPPQVHACHADMPAEVSCPRCGSTHTSLISEFGSTACKALYRCDSCREPFDYFKCI